MSAPTIEPLAPTPNVNFDCPRCGVTLNVTGWYVPGMRVLAELQCPSCLGGFYGDLQTGDAWEDPVLIEKQSGDIVSDRDDYFSSWLTDSYAKRRETRIDIDFDSITSLNRPVLVNSLDRLYGHSLLKLLHVQYILDKTNADPVVLVSSNLEWLVPDDVPAVWTVDLPFSRGTEWNDWLAERITREVAPIDTFEVCQLPPPPSIEEKL